MLPEILYDLKVKHLRFNPVFVVGHARSGTSVFIRLIRKYLKINFGTESQFIPRYYKKIDQYGDLYFDSNIKLLINDISKERCFSRWKQRFNFVLDREKVFTNLPERTYRGVLISIFLQFAKFHKMERWGDKTLEYIYHIPLLLELFPEAQFIHMVRDGRDVALSNFKAPFGEKNIYKAALRWKEQLILIDHFKKYFSEDQFIEIKYEDLLKEPEEVFRKLIDFLGIDDTEGELLNFISQNIRYDLKVNNAFKWKNQLSEKDRIIFDKIAGGYLNKYGYDTKFTSEYKFNIFQKLFWEIDNKIRKLIKLGYVKNNVYKIKIIFKNLFIPVRQKIYKG